MGIASGPSYLLNLMTPGQICGQLTSVLWFHIQFQLENLKCATIIAITITKNYNSFQIV